VREKMGDNRGLYMEESILNSLKSLLSGRVNEILGEVEFLVPPVEFSHKPNWGHYSVTPELAISGCERSEKERVVLLDAYRVTITFNCPEQSDRRSAGERNCYAYAAAVDRGLREDPALGGAADYALLVKKDYKGPKVQGSGEGWEAVLTLRIVVESGE
jgi:hypothetical protein